MKQRVLSLAVALAMALSLLPSVALAADEPEASGSAPETAETQPTEAEVLPPVEETNAPTPETPEIEPVVPADLVPASVEETAPTVGADGWIEVDSADDLTAALATGGNIRLTESITVTDKQSWSITKDVVLDLNNCTISSSYGKSNNYIMTVSDVGSLTITDNSAEKGGAIMATDPSYGYGIQLRSNSSFTLLGGTIETTQETVDIYTTAQDCSVTISGGKLVSTADNVLGVRGKNTTVNISDGEMESAGRTAVYISNYGGADSIQFTMTGGSLTHTDGRSGAIQIYKGATVTIAEDAEINAQYTGLQAQENVILNVTGGTIEAGGSAVSAEDQAQVNISGGEISSSSNSTTSGTVEAEGSAQVTITGGTLTSKRNSVYAEGSANVTISGGDFKNNTTSTANISKDEASDAKITVIGGTFDQTVPEEYLPSGMTQDENGTVQTDTEKAVASVKGIPYSTLQEAIKNAEAGDTVKLLKSTEGSGIVIPEGSELTIDLNGWTYTVTSAVGSPGTESNGFQLLKDSTITFKKGTINSGTAAVRILIQNYSDLTLDNVRLDGTNSNCSYMLSNNNGDVLIKDSTINAPANSFAFDVCWGPNSGYPDGTQVTVEGNSKINGKVEIGVWGDLTGQPDSKSTLHITGGEFNGEIVVNDALKDQAKEGNVSISGGTFQNASGNPIDVSDYVVPGMKQDDAGNIVVDTTTAVAEVNGMGYTDLQDAIDAAEATNGTVELIAEKTIEINTALTIEEPITIEGNGSTITATGCAALQIVADLESLTIKDLKLQGNLNGQQANEGTGAHMGIGTYDGCYGVKDLQLNNVTIDGFSYGMYFGQNPTGNVDPINKTPVSIDANNLTIQNCYIKGAYFEKLTESTFTDCTIADNGADPDQVASNNSKDWLCGIDINLKNGSYENIIFDGCTFTGNGANRGTALHIKARDDSDSYGTDTQLDGVTVEDCTFKDNNQPNDKDEPIVLGEPGKDNKTPINVSIQPDVNFTDNLAQGETYTVTFDSNGGSDVPTQVVKSDTTITLPEPTRSGYRFRNWSDGSSTYDAGDTVKITADTTFTASWSRISSGSSGSSSSNDYSITVDAGRHGDVTVRPSRAEQGETVTITVEPDTGYELDELIVTDSDGDEISVRSRGNGRYTFEMPRGRVTVEATFVAVEDSGLPFLDVASDAWYYDAVAYVYENGMMNGTSSNVFSPNATTTRGMIVTMLYRLEGEPRVSGTSTFDDVANGMYYADAIVWAAGNDIVTGYDETTFGPNDAITREQMAAILYRYAQYKGYRTTASADLSGYVDAGDVSSYALSALQWASAEGLVTGTSSTALTPGGSATRAQVATIFMRFMEDVAK